MCDLNNNQRLALPSLVVKKKGKKTIALDESHKKSIRLAQKISAFVMSIPLHNRYGASHVTELI